MQQDEYHALFGVSIANRLVEAVRELWKSPSARIRVWGRQTKQLVGLRPRVAPPTIRASKRLGPGMSTHKACLIISLDLELAWGWRYAKGTDDPVGHATRMAELGRANVPEILAVFEKHQMPGTWAVAGHLFLESCTTANGRAHPEAARPPHFENEFWKFSGGDWFDADPSSDWRRDPAWYAPDLVQAILAAQPRQEIACHTFSHVDFSSDVCPPNVADSELSECCRVAHQVGVELRSMVFPGNLPGNLDSLKRYGFTCYRVDTGYELDYPASDEHGLWRIPMSACIQKPSDAWGDSLWINTLKRYVDVAIETGALCHFWLHPCTEANNVARILPAVLEHVDSRRDEVRVTTMKALAAGLSSECDSGAVSKGDSLEEARS